MKRIVDGFYCVQKLRAGRVYVVEGKDGLTLVDTSLPNCRSIIEQQLQSSGFRLGDVKHILITHAHQDHIGSLAEIQQATGAQTYAHRLDAPIIRGEKPVPLPPPEVVPLFHRLIGAVSRGLPLPPPARVDHELEGGETLDMVLPGFQVIALPGHTPGQVGFWLPDQRLLFCGDVLMRVVGRLRTPFPHVTVDMAEEKRSIRKVADMDVNILCLGHGEPYIGNAAPVVRAFAQKLGV
jgi:glyoxylase-like metal-dependent hydrolase (beta-lactamase superfamily II)